MSSLEARDLAPAGELGAQFLAEIREQPRALEGLLEHESEFARVAAAARDRGAGLVRMVGHGSSDNAASYGVYAFGLLPKLTALRDSISLTVYYGTELDMSGSLVIGLSQSGKTPDVVEYVARARRAGAFTVAITNDPDSDLAATAEALLPLGAGPERAVAATKTYTNTLASLLLLAAHMAGQGGRCADDLRAVVEALDATIPELEQLMPEVALPFAFVGRMFVIGRGVELSTAREIALKLLETCRIAAEPLTATDLAHGPVAALDPFFPVWAIASNDQTLPAVVEAAARVSEAGATLVASGSAASSIPGPDYVLPVPQPPSPILSPILSVVPGQLF
ncbi:MAG TPA: SIS domain-containing protein, partial [Gaiellaceae bacterium]|nr:SIS domain-containing protein [Gaiellaceae bacterium]